ncbi:MAG TPA: hypothetical protein VHL50_11190, partial [Pyrinomonadaceae bacterium]|nr:hypothetical protein [Pyrinomonadaceae bacterium]
MAVTARLKNTFLAGFCLLAASIGALAQTSGRWLSIQAENLQIVGNASESNLRDAGVRLDEFRSLLAAVFPGLTAKRKALRVVVFPDQSTYTPFKPQKADGTADDGVRGYFATGDTVDQIAL